jgi:hypothetical protein
MWSKRAAIASLVFIGGVVATGTYFHHKRSRPTLAVSGLQPGAMPLPAGVGKGGPAPEVGMAAPDGEAVTLDGQKVLLSSRFGEKPLVLILSSYT